MIRVVSLPSEKVPAPPSPNWTFERISRPFPAQKAFDRLHPLFHRVTPLEDHDPVALPRQQPGGEDTGGAEPRDDDRGFTGLFPVGDGEGGVRLILEADGGFFPGEAGGEGRLVLF